MKKLVTSITLMVLINVIVVLYFMLYGAEKYMTFGGGIYTVKSGDNVYNNFLSLFPLVDFLLLFLYFIFSHSIPFYLNDEKRKNLKKFQIFRLIISLITLGLLIYYTINLFVNGGLVIYQLTFILILFFEIIYILIGCRIIEQYESDRLKIRYSALMVLLMYFSIGLFLTYAFYRVQNVDLIVFRFLLSTIALGIYAGLSGLCIYKTFDDDYNCYPMSVHSNGILSIVANLVTLLSLYFIYQYFYSYKFFLIVAMIVNIILIIILMVMYIGCVYVPKNRGSSSSSTSTSRSYSTSSYSTPSTTTYRPTNPSRSQTVVNKPEEIFVCIKRHIEAKPYNPHVHCGIKVCDWEVTLTCIFESNYGNQVTLTRNDTLYSKYESEVIPSVDGMYSYVLNGRFTKDRVSWPW